MAHPALAALQTAQSYRVAELARFFPEATPVRISIQIELCGRPSTDRGACHESTIIEFGTSREVLFSCAMHLEFGDLVHVRTTDGSLDAQTSVVAVQYQPGVTLVAARFLDSVPNWIVKS